MSSTGAMTVAPPAPALTPEGAVGVRPAPTADRETEPDTGNVAFAALVLALTGGIDPARAGLTAAPAGAAPGPGAAGNAATGSMAAARSPDTRPGAPVVAGGTAPRPAATTSWPGAAAAGLSGGMAPAGSGGSPAPDPAGGGNAGSGAGVAGTPPALTAGRSGAAMAAANAAFPGTGSPTDPASTPAAPPAPDGAATGTDPATTLPPVARAATTGEGTAFPAKAPIRAATARDPAAKPDSQGLPTGGVAASLPAPGLTSVTPVEVGSAAGTGRPEPFGAALDPERLMAELAHWARRADGSGFHVVTALEPRHLGRVEVRLELAGDQVRAQLAVTNPESLATLKAQEGHLQALLGEVGLQLAGFTVNLGGGRSNLREREPPAGGPRPTGPVPVSGSARDGTAAGTRLTGTAAIDYRA